MLLGYALGACLDKPVSELSTWAVSCNAMILKGQYLVPTDMRSPATHYTFDRAASHLQEIAPVRLRVVDADGLVPLSATQFCPTVHDMLSIDWFILRVVFTDVAQPKEI